jgi:EAL domain-containing protein (putative c-di-GMP-specific phosphodiesterase class I)
MRRLREIGVRISLDDSEAGYSSSTSSRSFSFDEIKIDRSLVNEVRDSADSRATMRAIAELASRLRVVTTAEGVESVDQLQDLHPERRGEAESFVFSMPMRSAKIREFLAAHQRLYGASVERWAPFRTMLIQAELEAVKRLTQSGGERRRATG